DFLQVPRAEEQHVHVHPDEHKQHQPQPQGPGAARAFPSPSPSSMRHRSPTTSTPATWWAKSQRARDSISSACARVLDAMLTPPPAPPPPPPPPLPRLEARPPRLRPAVLLVLLHPELRVGQRRDLRQMGDAQDLARLRHAADLPSHHLRRSAADPGVDLVEDI